MKETIQFLQAFHNKLGERFMKEKDFNSIMKLKFRMIDISSAIEVLKEEFESEIQLQKIRETVSKSSSGNCDCLFDPKPYYEDLITKEKRCNYCLKII